MNVKDLLEQQLLKEQQDKSTRERSGKYSPSSLGRCYRNQYWNRKNEPQSNPISVDTLKIFALGNMVHHLVQSLYPKERCEVKVETDDICGYADVVLDDAVIDIKSCRSYEFKLFAKPDYNIKGKLPNVLQVCAYALYLNKPKGQLVFIEKDALQIKTFDLLLTDWSEQLVEELNTLRRFWMLDKLPLGIPRAYGGKECNYCGWKDKCFTLDGDKLKLKEVK